MTPSEREHLDKEIALIIQDYTRPTWDRTGVEEFLDPASLGWTQDFLDELPEKISPPKLKVGEDGIIDMVWRKHNYLAAAFAIRYCTAAVSRSGRSVLEKVRAIDYNVMRSERGPINRVEWPSKEIPKEVLDLLYEIEGVRNEYK